MMMPDTTAFPGGIMERRALFLLVLVLPIAAPVARADEPELREKASVGLRRAVE